jgi:GNAT superfamily N-acetyltransferase
MIRRFTHSDGERCREIIRSCFDLNVILDFPVKQQVKGYLTTNGYLEDKAERSEIYVFENNRILGLGGLTDNKIERVYIDPNYQGRGIGRDLVKFLEELAKKRGTRELIVHAFLNSISFFHKNGYVISGKYVYEFPLYLPIHITEMRKDI